jgi:hypothetical protein
MMSEKLNVSDNFFNQELVTLPMAVFKEIMSLFAKHVPLDYSNKILKMYSDLEKDNWEDKNV